MISENRVFCKLRKPSKPKLTCTKNDKLFFTSFEGVLFIFQVSDIVKYIKRKNIQDL